MSRLFFPATQRNRDPILTVLREHIDRAASVIEVASGSGEHGVHFCAELPELTWLPTDIDPAHIASINAWREHTGLANLREPVTLDVVADSPPTEQFDVLFNANLIHISPPAATIGLLNLAAAVLPAGGALVLYGPYQRNGAHTADSNARFHESLQRRDPSWGVRHLEEVIASASERGLGLEHIIEMPANNLTVIYRKTP